MRVIQEKVSPEFKKWVDYCEKNKRNQLGTYEKPESYKQNAGKGNYTVFADLYNKKTGINVQGQPWCDCFTDTVFIHLFGVEKAQKLLGGFSAYTPTSAGYFKNMKRYEQKEPREGDLIFFHNGTRIYHTGYVYRVHDGIVYTIEGNTSSKTVLENEGGCVAYKQYPLAWTDGKRRIDGYGRPDYTLVETYTEGFLRAADGKRWWYQYQDGSYASNGWAWLNEKTGGTSGWYLFDKAGYMLTGFQKAPDGRNFFLCTEGIHEGQCMVTNDQGELILAEYDTALKKYRI